MNAQRNFTDITLKDIFTIIINALDSLANDIKSLFDTIRKWGLSPLGGGLFLCAICMAAFIVQFNITELTKDWLIKSPHQLRPHYLVAPFSTSIIAFAIYSFFHFICRKIRNFSPQVSSYENRVFWTTLLVSSAWFLTVVASLAPGWFSDDVLYTYHMSRAGWWSGWYSPVHPFIYTLLLQIIPSMWFVTSANAFFAAMSISTSFSLLARMGLGPKLIALLFILLLVAPPVLVMVLMPIRDSFFASFFILAIVLTLKQLLDRNMRNFRNTLFVMLIWTVLAAYRTDIIPAAFFAFLFLIIAYLKVRAKVSRLPVCLAICATVYVIFTSTIPNVLGSAWAKTAENEYKLTLISHPLTFLMREGFYTSSPEKDKLVIEKVFTYDDLKKYWSPYNIAVFYGGGWNKNSTIEERNEVVGVASKLFLDNMGVFLTSKFMLFMRATGLQENEHFFYYSRGVLPEKRVLVPNLGAEFNWVGEKLTFFIESSQNYNGFSFSGRMLYWNLIIPNLVLVLALFLWPVARGSAIFAGLILVRESAVIVGAPSTFVHYHFPVFISGLIVTGLLITEMQKFLSAKAKNNLLKN